MENAMQNLSLENSQQTRKVIETLITDDNTKVSDQQGILDEMGQFYEKLYMSQNVCQVKIDEFL